LEAGLVTKMKVGPGLWNDLLYINLSGTYTYNDDITNIIGDVITEQSGEDISDIIRKMISPYIDPAVITITNNGSESGQANEKVFEIGHNLSGTGATPINATASGFFSNEGNFSNVSPINLNVLAPYQPSTPATITISFVLTHIQGQTSAFTTTIVFKPKLMWVSSPLSAIPDSVTFMAQPAMQSVLSMNSEGIFSFTANYSWLAIPVMILPGNPNFVDITNPNVPIEYDMVTQNQIMIDNGIGTYMYQLYRSSYPQLSATTLQVFEL
jgi:hypothetical protein